MHILLGSHGVGKSTLLEKYCQSTVNPIYVSDGFSRPCRTFIESQPELQSRSLFEHQMINHFTEWFWKQNVNQPNIICTRSIIDSIIYSKVLGFSDFLNQTNLESLFEFDKCKIQGVFYIPIEFPIEEDGIRFTGTGVQEMIDNEIREFLSKHLITFIEIKGSLEERVKTLQNGLHLFKDKHQ